MQLYNPALCRERAMFFRRQDLGFLRVRGPDAGSFLQGQLSSDVRSLPLLAAQPSTRLDKFAKVIASALVLRLDLQDWLLITEGRQEESLASSLDRNLISEDAEILAAPEWAAVEISGPSLPDLAEEILGLDWSAGSALTALPLPQNLLALRHSSVGEEGLLLLGEPAALEMLCQGLAKAGIAEGDEACRRALVIEGGLPEWGADYDASCLLPETGLQTSCVSFTKGCFVGQEIVARVQSRGNVNRLLGVLRLRPGILPQVGEVLDVRGRPAGVVRSLVTSAAGEPLAVALLNRGFFAPGQEFDFDCAAGRGHAEVFHFPMRQRTGETAAARVLLEQGLGLFIRESGEGDSAAESLLRQAIRRDPKLGDAYEALGVILGRQNRLDEAITLMKRLAELEPDAVMPYTNLSLFYMRKGLIAEAEEEKTQATLAAMRVAAKQRKMRLNDEKMLEQKRAEINSRLGMFRQVLEIDADDLVAHFGLGKNLAELGSIDEALPHLRRCLEIKPDYSAAALILGRTLAARGDKAAAREVLSAGISGATRSGDFQPRREMEALLNELKEEI